MQLSNEVEKLYYGEAKFNLLDPAFQLNSSSLFDNLEGRSEFEIRLLRMLVRCVVPACLENKTIRVIGLLGTPAHRLQHRTVY